MKDNATETKITVVQSLLRAFQAGWIAAKIGYGENPYSHETEEYAQWQAGYRKYIIDAASPL